MFRVCRNKLIFWNHLKHSINSGSSTTPRILFKNFLNSQFRRYFSEPTTEIENLSLSSTGTKTLSERVTLYWHNQKFCNEKEVVSVKTTTNMIVLNYLSLFCLCNSISPHFSQNLRMHYTKNGLFNVNFRVVHLALLCA